MGECCGKKGAQTGGRKTNDGVEFTAYFPNKDGHCFVFSIFVG